MPPRPPRVPPVRSSETKEEHAFVCKMRLSPDVGKTYGIGKCNGGCVCHKPAGSCVGNLNGKTHAADMLMQTLRSQGLAAEWYSTLPHGALDAVKPGSNQAAATFVKAITKRPGARAKNLEERRNNAHAGAAVQRLAPKKPRESTRRLLRRNPAAAPRRKRRAFTARGNRIDPLAEVSLLQVGTHPPAARPGRRLRTHRGPPALSPPARQLARPPVRLRIQPCPPSPLLPGPPSQNGQLTAWVTRNMRCKCGAHLRYADMASSQTGVAASLQFVCESASCRRRLSPLHTSKPMHGDDFELNSQVNHAVVAGALSFSRVGTVLQLLGSNPISTTDHYAFKEEIEPVLACNAEESMAAKVRGARPTARADLPDRT